jgi:predicted pyridoxine 5'-phosphate oxidase superfamily flavin-nucleotide-binding protein
MADLYHDGQRRLQDRFDTRRMADLLDRRKVADHTSESDREFLARMDMVFIATADDRGRPNCSYKGGEPGFVRVVDERTLALPNYDGNGMYLTWGNVLANPEVGLLFVDWERQRRLRINGSASIHEDDPLLADYPEAQFIVRVRVREVFPNCPRYIHRMALVERSRFVPHRDKETPVPGWKRADWMEDEALPAGDPALDPSREQI